MDQLQRLKKIIEESIKDKNTVFLFTGDKGSTLLTHVVKDLDIKIIFIDTGCQFGEISEYVNSFLGKIEIIGNNNVSVDYIIDANECCRQRKKSVLEDYLQEANAKCLIVPFIEEEKEYGTETSYLRGIDDIEILRPLAEYTERHIWMMIKKNNLQYSRIYNKGYRLVDCKCCITRFGKRCDKDNKKEEFYKETEKKLRALGYL